MPMTPSGRYLYENPLTGELVSRQRIYQLWRKADGLCITCGGDVPVVSATYCAVHQQAATDQKRRRRARAR